MDQGRRLTIQQKKRRQRFLIFLAVFPILAFALWLFLGRQKTLLFIGCVSAAIGVLSWVYLGIYYGLLWILERDGSQVTYRANRKLEILFCSALVVSAGFAGYLLYRNLPELDELFCRITSPIPVPEIKPDIHFPDVKFSLSDIRVDFWHIASAIVCLGVVIITFCSHIWGGIIAVPVMAVYGILFWRACDGNYPENMAAYIELLAYGLIIMLVSGLLMRNYTGFSSLLMVVRFLVPFTLICMVAIYLQDENPAGAPPLNFRAVLFWGYALVFFAGQSLQLLGVALPEYDGPDLPDNPVPEQSGDEYGGSGWW